MQHILSCSAKMLRFLKILYTEKVQLQHTSEVYGQVYCCSVLSVIFGVEQDTITNARRVFFAKSI